MISQFYDFKNGNFDSLQGSLTRLPFEAAALTDVNEYWLNWKDLFRQNGSWSSVN